MEMAFCCQSDQRGNDMPKLIDMTGSARILGTTPSTIYQRLCAGWSELEAVTVPVGMRRRKK